ncbi:MAG: Rab family GTPase [Promethearchaeota archaeon]
MPDPKDKDEDIEVVFHNEIVFKVVVVGDPEVGKTSLIKRFTQASFTADYIPTVGVNIAKHVVKAKTSTGKDAEVHLMFWDIAGQQQFYMLHQPYFAGAEGVIFVFDTTRAQSFTNMKEWHKATVKYGIGSAPAILVGNKIDLRDQRKIIVPMAENLAKQLGIDYYETSALTGENVDKIFMTLTRLMIESKNV